MKNLLLVLITTVSIISCTKPTTTKVEGAVLQKETLIPVENAMIVFSQYYSKGLIEGIVEWPIDTVYTDSSGEFVWETDINPRNSTYDSPGGFFIEGIYVSDYFVSNRDGIGIQGNKTDYSFLDQEKLHIEMTPHAYLDINFINEATPDTNYIKFGGIQTDAKEELFGETKATTFLIPGNQQIIYQYTTDMNLVEWNIDSFYIEAFETNMLEFTY